MTADQLTDKLCRDVEDLFQSVTGVRPSINACCVDHVKMIRAINTARALRERRRHAGGAPERKTGHSTP